MGKPLPLNKELVRKILQIRLLAFDFDGVFTDNKVYTFQDGKEAVCCNRSDGLLLRNVEELGIEIWIISTETNPVVSARAAKLRIPCLQSCENKLQAVQKLCRERNLDLSEVGFVGNDVNDLECLKNVGFPIVVQDAYSEVVAVARYQTQACGGNGAVREICDLFLNVRGKNREKKCF